jgi:hypothetical protein
MVAEDDLVSLLLFGYNGVGDQDSDFSSGRGGSGPSRDDVNGWNLSTTVGLEVASAAASLVEDNFNDFDFSFCRELVSNGSDLDIFILDFRQKPFVCGLSSFGDGSSSSSSSSSSWITMEKEESRVPGPSPSDPN